MSATTETCGRCWGRGIISAWGHIDNGACYACGGSGTVTVPEPAKLQVLEMTMDGTLRWAWGGRGVAASELRDLGRAALLRVAKESLAAVSKPHMDGTPRSGMERRWRMIHFASCCWASGDSKVIWRGRRAVAHLDHSGDISTYMWAIDELTKAQETT